MTHFLVLSQLRSLATHQGQSQLWRQPVHLSLDGVMQTRGVALTFLQEFHVPEFPFHQVAFGYELPMANDQVPSK